MQKVLCLFGIQYFELFCYSYKKLSKTIKLIFVAKFLVVFSVIAFLTPTQLTRYPLLPVHYSKLSASPTMHLEQGQSCC